MTAAVVIVAAGTGSRLNAGVRKGVLPLQGESLVERSARAFSGIARVIDRVVVLHADDLAEAEASGLQARLRILGVTVVTRGGATRQESVLNGVRATRPDVRDVLVHDAARPFVAADRIEALLDALDSEPAVLLAQRASSTVKRVEAGAVVETVDRDALRLATTPQGGRRELLLSLLERALDANWLVTDESALFERAGYRPRVVEDLSTNLKITTPGDLVLARGLLAPTRGLPRVGHGFDIHRLVPGRKLILGGVEIPCDVGLLGHSDADVLLHAIIEALLGAAGLPDIGEHFPDNDPRYRGIASTELLAHTLAELRARGLRPLQIDTSVIAERPRLRDWKPAIRASLEHLLGLPADRVGVKARTHEGLDAVGRGEAISCHAIALVGE